MRRVDYLITQARRESENEDFSDYNGIPDQEFIQYANDAQHRLQSVIVQQHPKVFVHENTITAVADTESYDLPTDIYLGNKISSIEYSSSGVDNYYPLRLGELRHRTPGATGLPYYYIRRTGDILMAPTPQSSGLIRVNYVRRIRELDVRRGTIDTATLATDTITAMSIDHTETNFAANRTSLLEHEYICVVNKYGIMKMKNIPIDAIDAGTGDITVTAGYTFDSGETFAVGDYVVGGQDTVTHSELPRTCERYLIKYMVFRALKRDSSVDFQEAQSELMAMEQDIVASFADLTDDIILIPDLESNSDWWY